jgi:hypothetical protein
VYLETSKDILNLVLAFCALWFTAFLCWLLWYVISILRDVTAVVREIHEKIAAIDRAVHAAKEKIESHFGSFGAAAAGIKMLGSYLDKRRDKMAEQAMAAARKIKKKVSKVKKRLKEELQDDEEEESEDLS